MRFLALFTTIVLAAHTPLTAADAPPAKRYVRKGEVVAVDAKAGTLTLRAIRGSDRFKVTGGALAQLVDLQPGDYVEGELDTAQTIFRFVKIQKAKKGGGPAGGKEGAAPASVNLVVMADAACRLLVNAREVGATKPVPGSEKDHKAELSLAPGSYILKAVTSDGREWEGEVKPGRDVQTVRIALPPAPASPAEFDTAAAQAWLALRDARTLGRAIDPVMEGNFAYLDFDLSLVFAAQDALKRVAAALKPASPSDAARQQALAELKRAASHAEKYLGLLSDAVKTAVEENRAGKGSAARGVHAQARALEGRVVPDRAALASIQGSPAFRQALPPDRQAEVGAPPDAQDFALGADYCHCRPAVLAVVERDGLAGRHLKLEAGDAVVSADGKPLASVWELKLALRAAAGRKLKLGIERKGRPRDLDVKVPSALPQ